MSCSGCTSRDVGAAGTARLVIAIRPPISIVEPTSRWKINNIALTLQAHHVVSPPRVSIVVNKSVANSAQDFRVESKDGGWQRSLFLEEGQEDGEGDSGEATAVEDVEGEVGEGDSGEATAVEDVEGEVGEEEEGASIITG
jgi:hypothetical protein